MNKKSNVWKLVGGVATVLGGIISFISYIADGKQLETEIDEIVEQKLAERFQEETEETDEDEES